MPSVLRTAKYLDAKLRSGGGRGMDDAELEKVLNDVLYLFRFTQGTIMRAFVRACSDIQSD
jgi:cullin-4